MAKDDDIVDDEEGGPWFNMSMSIKEKIEARKPWRKSTITKLIGKKFRYHYLRHEMWQIQSSIAFIDLPNDFYIVIFTSCHDLDTALLNGSWMIGRHYLRVHRWKPNFMVNSEVITHLPIWVKFPYCRLSIAQSLERASN